MAFQGFALFALSALGLASLLFFIYNSSSEQQQTYGSENYGNTSEPNVDIFSDRNSWNETSSGQRRRRRRRSMKSNQIDTMCTICLKNVQDKKTILPCYHQFHSACIDDWRSQGPTDTCDTCPNCRMSYKAFEMERDD